MSLSNNNENEYCRDDMALERIDMAIHEEKYESFSLRNGLNVILRHDLYEKVMSNFAIYEFWERHIIAQGYFPQIVQFIVTMFLINSGERDFLPLLIANLIVGVSLTVIWNYTAIYKIPGLSFLSALIGGNLFRTFIHFIFITIMSIFYYRCWWLILHCAVSGFITQFIKSWLSTPKYTYERNNRMAEYAIAVMERFPLR